MLQIEYLFYFVVSTQPSSSSASIQQLLSRDVACQTENLETHICRHKAILKVYAAPF